MEHQGRQSVTAASAWPTWARWVVTLILGFHILAMLGVAFSGAPASDLEREFARAFGAYPYLVGMDSVHRYYAPAPPPTPVVTAELTFEGGATETLRLPDRGIWPRLRYQRQLALAHHLNSEFQRAAHDPRGPRPSVWGASYARHLLAKNPTASSVTLRVQHHLIPDLVRLRESGPDSGALDPDDERYFTVPELIGTYPRELEPKADSAR